MNSLTRWCFAAALVGAVVFLELPTAEAQVRPRDQSIAAALPDGGRLIFRDGCITDDRSHRLVARGESFAARIGFTDVPGKFQFRTYEGWCNLLAETGFSVEDCPAELDLLSNRVFLCRKRRVGSDSDAPAAANDRSSE